MGIETIIGITAALAAAASTATQLARGSGSRAPQIAAAPAPVGLQADLSPDEIMSKNTGNFNSAPNFLQFGSGMTNAQRRAQLATFGSFGNDSRFTDPAAKDYWKKLLVEDYTNWKRSSPGSGASFDILPSERQYAERAFGAKPRGDTAESFLSAILRG